MNQTVTENSATTNTAESTGTGFSKEPAATDRPGYEPAREIEPHTNRYKILRRDGSVADFDSSRISLALTKAFIAVEGESGPLSSRVRDLIQKLTGQVIANLEKRLPGGGLLHIEHIQDVVELSLMRAGEHEVARKYVIYREKRAQEREADRSLLSAALERSVTVKRSDGSSSPLDIKALSTMIAESADGLDRAVEPEKILSGAIANLYDGVSEDEVLKATIFSARALIEFDPAYSLMAARLLLHQMRKEATGHSYSPAQMAEAYADYFHDYIETGVNAGMLDARLKQFDLQVMAAAIKPERDLQFQYLGLQTLYDRYLLHIDGRRFELPQAFWMRVAMGLAINEIERERQAIQFYELLSKFDFVSSTPTLFNSGTLRPQLSSCFLTTVQDDLVSIYDCIKENALLSKYSGGLGNDWTPVRALGAHIRGTNGKSQGVVPFLKVVNDTAVAVNQGGKRQGAVCSYLESWHIDIEEFLELRKNTGDDRRRCHDMNTANWIPDLFMERVIADDQWTLFSPDEVPDLHDLCGANFKERYEHYEKLAQDGQIKLSKRVPAVSLWRKMLSMLFETGHPWITFKDACNLRSPQQHTGVVHSSNLCTEITLNTSGTETAVCNLGSINLSAHIKEGDVDREKLAHTVRVAMRMLDNVIDINFYTVSKARQANLRHRPVGLGIMAFQDALYKLRIAYASEEAVAFADRSQELVSYYAILASSELARERGAYASYKGSLWDQGVLPIDSIALLESARSQSIDCDRSAELDWSEVRGHIAQFGMRNSNCLAIAPTATISNIAGVSQSIEPTFQNLFVKSNLSGDFTVINPYLAEDLKERGLWDEVMVHDLKYFDGSVLQIERVPDDLKQLYATAFEIEPGWLLECASRRQKWIDQSQSLNLYMAEPSGWKLDEMYKSAWKKGLKTTYYLRTTSATATEKSTVRTDALNAVKNTSKGSGETAFSRLAPVACSITDPDCEACQ